MYYSTPPVNETPILLPAEGAEEADGADGAAKTKHGEIADEANVEDEAEGIGVCFGVEADGLFGGVDIDLCDGIDLIHGEQTRANMIGK